MKIVDRQIAYQTDDDDDDDDKAASADRVDSFVSFSEDLYHLF